METGAKYFTVGISFVILIIVFVGTLLWFTKIGRSDDQDLYSIFFKEHSLSGLQIGSPVTHRGIKAGSVKSIDFSKDNIEEVKVLIEVIRGTPVKSSTEAVITRNLVTGVAVIDLTKTLQESPPLPQPPPGEPHQLIREGMGQFDLIQRSMPEVLEELNQTVKQLSGFLSTKNQESIEKLLSSSVQITQSLTLPGQTPGETLGEVRKLALDVDKTINEVQTFAKGTETKLTGATERITKQVESMAEKIGRASQEISLAVSGLERPRELLYGPPKSSYGPGEK